MKYNNKGFTLPEIVLSISIIAILTVISFGDIVGILNVSKIKQEETQLAEIKKAMQAFMSDKGQLPDEAGNTLGSGTTNWAQDLAGYTNLSEDEMMFDSWLRVRQYKVFSQQEVFRAVTFQTYYGVVYSYGDDGNVDTDAVLGVLHPGAVLSAPLNNFPLDGTDYSIYLSLEVGNQAGDDQFFKISDRQEKMKNYETTVSRLSAVSSALQVYSQAMNNFAISNSETNWETKLFFPPSEPQNGSPADTAAYGNEIVGATGEMNTFLGRLTVRTDAATDDIRRVDMTNLMRLLGLPDSNCCSAMELGSDNLPKPFYYFSNPRRKLGGGTCQARGSNPVTDVILPPRITLNIEADTCG